ncbi:MAG: outer membrane protein assembly factor BamA [Candidatus Krumholzibacteriia bacterium]
MRFNALIRTAVAAGIAACVVAFLGGPSGASAAEFGVEFPTIKRIEILGNMSFDDAALMKRMRTKEARFYRIFRQPKYRRDFLRRDVVALEAFYRMSGFFEAQVTIESVVPYKKSRSVKIRILVIEGPRSVVRALRFAGQGLIREADLTKGLNLVPGAPYNPNLLEADRYVLLSKFFENGYLGAKVTQEVRVDSTDIDIDWTITVGDAMRIRDTRVSGTKTVREDLVRRELILARGEIFREKNVVESTQNLYDTGYFNSVEIEPDSIDLARREVDLLVKVRERKMGYIETGVGAGNIYGNRLFGEWGQRNVFGTGNVFSLKSSYAFQLFRNNELSTNNIDFRSEYVRHEGELGFPHALGTWNTFSLGAFYERDAMVEPVIIKDLGLTARIARRFSRQTSLLFGYSIERIQRLEVEEEKSRSRQRALFTTFARDTRDFYFNPQRGTYVTGEGRFTGGFLGGEDNYYSLVGSVRRYALLGRGSVFAWRVHTGYADAFGASSETGLPIESRFFAGGGNSVRGYRENSLGPLGSNLEPRGGRVTLLTNAELRFPIPYLARYNFGAAVFLDGGTVWNSVEEIRLSDFRITADRADVTRGDYMYGAGIGFRYYTPVGPLRFDIGFPLKRAEDMDFDYRIHISLGQIF